MSYFGQTSVLAYSNCVHCAGDSPRYKCSTCVTEVSIRAEIPDAFESHAGEELLADRTSGCSETVSIILQH